jgi:hypothetical protein
MLRFPAYIVMRRIGLGIGLIAIASILRCTLFSGVVVEETAPSFSFEEIASIVNRPLDNVYESAYPNGFCTEERPIIQLTTNDVTMFLSRYVKDFGLLRPSQIPKVRNAVSTDTESRGVIVLKNGECYHWHLVMLRNLYLFDGHPNYTLLYVTNEWNPKVATNMTHTRFDPPSSKEVSSFSNEPKSRPEFEVIDCKREEILAFLDHYRTNRFVTRCDAMRQMKDESTFKLGGIIYKRGGVLQCSNGKIIFWELLTDDKLFLEDGKGASCLLEK